MSTFATGVVIGALGGLVVGVILTCVVYAGIIWLMDK